MTSSKLNFAECIVLQAGSHTTIDERATLENVQALIREHNELNKHNEFEAAREYAQVKTEVLDIMGLQRGKFITTDNLKNLVFVRLCKGKAPEVAEDPVFATRISKVTERVVSDLINHADPILEAKRRGGVRLIS